MGWDTMQAMFEILQKFDKTNPSSPNTSSPFTTVFILLYLIFFFYSQLEI